MTELTSKNLVVKSSAFKHNETIPKKYSCEGDNVNPPLTIEGIPKQTKSLALIMDDPDAPSGTYVHWVVWNIDTAGKIEQNSVPGNEGVNSANQSMYTGPCPPSGTHRYFFKVYALDTDLDLPKNSTKQDLQTAMQNHIIAKGELIGLYKLLK